MGFSFKKITRAITKPVREVAQFVEKIPVVGTIAKPTTQLLQGRVSGSLEAIPQAAAVGGAAYLTAFGLSRAPLLLSGGGSINQGDGVLRDPGTGEIIANAPTPVVNGGYSTSGGGLLDSIDKFLSTVQKASVTYEQARAALGLTDKAYRYDGHSGVIRDPGTGEIISVVNPGAPGASFPPATPGGGGGGGLALSPALLIGGGIALAALLVMGRK